ncbi:hypothetical protein [Microcoleus sp. D3_18a_C4]
MNATIDVGLQASEEAALALFGIWGMAGVLGVLDLILVSSKTAMLLVE